MRALPMVLLLTLTAVGCCPVVHETAVSYPASRGRGADRQERPSRWPALVGAAAMGAVVGGLVGSSACDDLHETDEECEDRTVESALIGGGVGVLLGAALTAE